MTARTARERRLRRARSIALSALGMLAASTLLPGPIHAQTDTGSTPSALGGYDGSAHSSGLHVFYNPEGLLPTAAVLDVGSPDALATITSGPVTFARASVADPGDLLANPDALFTQADPRYPEGTFPEYPFRISANSTIGESHAESRPAPGLESRVDATSAGSTAESRTAASEAPGVASFGSMHARSTTTFDGTAIVVRSRTEVSAFDLLGVLEIDSIVTEVVAKSAGVDTEVDGRTVVTGATFMDQPVIIDEEGIRTDPEADSPDAPLLGAVRDAVPEDLTESLAAAGIRIRLPGPVERDGKTTGSVASTGLRIEFELSKRTAPALNELLGSVPAPESPIPGAPSLADAIVLLRATHVSALEVARAQASLTARPAYVPPPFESSGPSITPSVGGAPVAALSPPIARSPVPAGSTPAPSAGAPVATQPAGTSAPAASLGAGIGALALLALLAQPFIGDRIARAGAAVLGTGPTDTCPLAEEP